MKMQEKYKQLLEALLESSKEFLNSQELGELAGISQRTVIRYMKELKEQSLKYGFFIHPLEEKTAVAAAQAQKRCGAPIWGHTEIRYLQQKKKER